MFEHVTNAFETIGVGVSSCMYAACFLAAQDTKVQMLIIA